MIEALLAYFERGFKPSDEEIAFIESVVFPKKLKRGEFLQREGELARWGAFVVKGLLRSYVVDIKGKEHIMQFAPENWWISDKAGMMANAKAEFFIDAVEDAEILCINLQGHLAMMEKIPGYAALFHAGTQKRTIAKDDRIVNALTATAEQRYDNFIATYPSLADRAPKHMLASYLGITPETLSRIRTSRVQKK